jgi:hypothetical protein
MFSDMCFMRYHDNSLTFGMKLVKQFEDAFAGFAVQIAGWLIGKQYARITYQGPCDSNTLLFTSRELVGFVRYPVGQSYPFECLPGPFSPAEPAVARINQRHLDIPLSGELAE